MERTQLYLIIVFGIILLFVILKDYIIENFAPIFPIFTGNNVRRIKTTNNTDLTNPTNNSMYLANPVNMFVQNQQNDSLDRYYNPVRYPYQTTEKYYPNLMLPPQVIGCGGRNYPCAGGSQIPVIATNNLLDFSNSAIAPISPVVAPVNIRTRGGRGMPQQVGTIYRLRSAHNEVLPLFGRKEYPGGSNNWEYYTMAGDYGVKLKIVSKKRGEQLGTNDVVFIKGYNRFPYRVTMYDYDFPQYIPY